ncbi:alpha/beta-hydrolase [Thozetella sp. PMI_491]|nr:alpha/beta-hydrolase [Thozetella sp. PMI_491]
MPSFWTRQPGTAVYTAYFIVSTLCQLPWYLASYISRKRRPNPMWTYRQSVCRFLARAFLDYTATIELQQPVKLEPGKEGARFVLLPPGANNVYADILRCDVEIQPVTIGGIWFPEPYPAVPHQSSASGPKKRLVIFHLHGGAYLLGSARDLDLRHAVESLIHTFSSSSDDTQYRVSSQPNNRFPAAFQDAVTAYVYLVRQLKISPREIILSGDSAGAHLALALLRYIVSHPSLFPAEDLAGCLLWSPWPDMALTIEQAINRPAVQVDYIPPRFIRWSHREFLPRAEASIVGGRKNPFLSPNREGIKTSIPIWIQWGSAEVLRPDILRLVEVQKSIEGARVGECETSNAPHDIWLAGPVLGWNTENAMAMRNAAEFIHQSSAEKYRKELTEII